jgi:hypothetical protein
MQIFGANQAISQSSLDNYPFEPSKKQPFGAPNPQAPKELGDFAPLIGVCDCKSITRGANGEWQKDTVNLEWKFKYILNGMAIQDESLKSDGTHTTSIRQYQADSAAWYVTFFSSASIFTNRAVWKGNKKGNDIVLYQSQKAPNGMDGFSRLTFYDISSEGYSWKGEWVDKTEKFTYATWMIYCKRKKGNG